MIVFPVLIPGQNFLFPGTGREITKCHGKGSEGKFEACIPGNHGKREFPLTPATMHQSVIIIMVMIVTVIMVMKLNLIDGDVGKGAASAEDD